MKKSSFLTPAMILWSGAVFQSFAWNDGLALTPTMGWNSYYQFGENISEALIKRIADAMDTNGMRAAGYNYIVLDDAWMGPSRDGSGNLMADASKFPSGMKALGDYLHAKGFKYGIYEDRGTTTCYGLPGSYNYEYQDAAQFAAWGVDFVKIDNCAAVGDLQTVYTKWHDAIQASGRPMVYNICAWGFPGAWVTGVAHSWRSYGDLWDGWGRIMDAMDVNANLAAHAGPGHWNDPDILQVGRGGMTWDQYRAHFSLWAIMAAPLIASGDMGLISAETRSILLNTEVIAVDQDSLGVQGTRVKVTGGKEVWSKALKDGSRAVLLFNRDYASAPISVSFSDIGISGGWATVRDLWAHADKGKYYNAYTATVPATGVVMLKIAASSAGTVDNQPPSDPVILPPTAIVPYNRVRLNWRPSTDNVGVTGYRIYKNGAYLSATAETTLVADSLAWNTLYRFSVRAEDGTGNLSDSSNAVNFTTGSPSSYVYLSDLNWVSATTGWGTVQKDKSIQSNTLTLRKKTYAKGLGTHAVSRIVYALNGQYANFASDIGADDECDGSVVFSIYANGVKKYDSGILNATSPITIADIDVSGVDTLRLEVGDGGDGINCDHADWADAMLIRAGAMAPKRLPSAGAPKFGLTLQSANPFRASLRIQYRSPADEAAHLAVYTLSGKKVRTLLNGWTSVGTFGFTWDGRNNLGRKMPAGVYLIRYASAGNRAAVKAVLER